MSSNFPNEVYVPTGTADGRDFIQISGYCYKKVAENITVVDKPVRNDIFGDYDDCKHCNSCECNKTIDFFIGGILYESGGANSFVERKVSIQTSSKGWQEIALESGYLNNNDTSLNFKPLQIRCYDRKIDMREGIYVSFNDRNAEIAKFNYITAGDIYERQDLYWSSIQGYEQDFPPDWAYKNQYDKVQLANKINTIKFKSLCEYDCPTQDITFRIRGQIQEPSKYLNLGSSYDGEVTSWVYATCSGMPITPGQIVDCTPNGTGIDFTQYFSQDYTGLASDGTPRPPSYEVLFAPTSMDVVNMPILLGDDGTSSSKHYSVTGSGHFLDYMFDSYNFYTAYTARTTYVGLNSGIFYHGMDGTGVDFNYAKDIGQEFGLYYNRPTGCLSTGVIGTDFNSFYRHIGGNTLAKLASPGTTRGETYEGCYQTSEFADGIFKNGTYVPMYWTGIITGNAEEYYSFIDQTFVPNDPETFQWETGVYVYQWYKDADRSDANSITGFFGFLNDGTTQAQHDHYRSVLFNHSPVNVDDPLFRWNIRSGDYAIADAEKQKFSFILDFDENLAYEYGFSRADMGIRHSGDSTSDYAPYAQFPITKTYTYTTSSTTAPQTSTTQIYLKNGYNNYAFQAVGSDSALNRIDEPQIATNTFVRPSVIDEAHPLTDSGNPLHSAVQSPINYTTGLEADYIEMRRLKNIQFQLSFKKE
ncbi:MAG: hypothetical protein EBY39_06270 [Flavobacteriia bacterium]|nr:hypothetical protein [Flavobacteriia bacterium]